MSKTADTRQRITEIKTAIAPVLDRLDRNVESWKVEGSHVALSEEQAKSFQDDTAEVTAAREAIALLEGKAANDEFFNSPAAPSVAGQDAAMRAAGQPESKSLGELFTGGDEWKTLQQTRRGTAVLALDADDEQSEYKDVFTARGGNRTAPAFGLRENLGVVPLAERPLAVLDLFPHRTTRANLIEFMRISGFTNNAAVVRERTAADGTAPTGLVTDVFGLKPESDLTFENVAAPVRTVAHTIRASKTILDDEPRLRGTIDGKMAYGVRFAVELQVLAGTGANDTMLGVLNTPGEQGYQRAAGDAKSTAIRKASTRALLAQYPANGVVLHPFDWEDMELERDAQGRLQLVTNVSVGAEQRIWRLRVAESQAIAQNTALVGSFGLGADIWDREQVNVMVSTEDRDNFVRNAVTIRAEWRGTVTVESPESFVKVNLVPAA